MLLQCVRDTRGREWYCSALETREVASADAVRLTQARYLQENVTAVH